jgi:hypothetical protein
MCLESYEEEHDQHAEFGPTVISRHTVFFSNGSILAHDASLCLEPPQIDLVNVPYSKSDLTEAFEFALKLESAIKPLCHPHSDEPAIFTSFVLAPVLQPGDQPLQAITDASVRQAFNDTIHSSATVFVVAGMDDVVGMRRNKIGMGVCCRAGGCNCTVTKQLGTQAIRPRVH